METEPTQGQPRTALGRHRQRCESVVFEDQMVAGEAGGPGTKWEQERLGPCALWLIFRSETVERMFLGKAQPAVGLGVACWPF